MKVYIINISDSPASISLEETKKGESFLQDNKYIYEINLGWEDQTWMKI